VIVCPKLALLHDTHTRSVALLVLDYKGTSQSCFRVFWSVILFCILLTHLYVSFQWQLSHAFVPSQAMFLTLSPSSSRPTTTTILNETPLGNDASSTTTTTTTTTSYSGPASKPLLDKVTQSESSPSHDLSAKYQPLPLTASNIKSLDLTSTISTLTIPELKQLSNELRWEILESVSKTGGHLGSSLGVVELTVALHHVFNTPIDKIIWDVAHQCYPHKILTGRRSRMHSIRQQDGISGFCKRKESFYDAFGAGHSSTSISAAQGMSIGKQIVSPQEKNNCIAVIGDGAITGGMAYEAMNSAGYLKNRMVSY